MEDFTEGSAPGRSRYFRLSEDKRLEFKRRQKARYWQNAESIRKRCYQRVLDAGKIKCPKQATLKKYDLQGTVRSDGHPLRKSLA